MYIFSSKFNLKFNLLNSLTRVIDHDILIRLLLRFCCVLFVRSKLILVIFSRFSSQCHAHKITSRQTLADLNSSKILSDHRPHFWRANSNSEFRIFNFQIPKPTLPLLIVVLIRECFSLRPTSFWVIINVTCKSSSN